jgi:hypothetical protein
MKSYPKLELYTEVFHMAFPWIPATYTVSIFVEAPPEDALPALACALCDHADRNHLEVLAFSFATSSSGAVASLHYPEAFEDYFESICVLAESNPDWHMSHRGPVLAWPEHDLKIQSQFYVERTHVAITYVKCPFDMASLSL